MMVIYALAKVSFSQISCRPILRNDLGFEFELIRHYRC